MTDMKLKTGKLHENAVTQLILQYNSTNLAGGMHANRKTKTVGSKARDWETAIKDQEVLELLEKQSCMKV